MKTKPLLLPITFLFTLAAFLISFASAAFSEEPLPAKLKSEQELVKHLESLMNCKKATKAETGKGDSNFYCNLKFRGTDIDVAVMNLPTRQGTPTPNGQIYLNALGKSQVAWALSGRCMVINFGDPDLVIDGHGESTAIVFQNDGNISYLFENGKERDRCVK
ncbi:MAG: hypothetical protein U1F57_06105 [bacterium]